MKIKISCGTWSEGTVWHKACRLYDKVYIFEANPECVNCFEDPKFTFINKAAWIIDGEVGFFIKEKRDALNIIMDHYGESELREFNERMMKRVIIIKIQIESMTGKKSGY